MTTQLIEPIQTLDERVLGKVSASEALDIVIKTLEMHSGTFFTHESVRWLRCFIEEATKYPVSTCSKDILLGDLGAGDIGRGLMQWFYSVMCRKDLHLLASTYTFETSNQVLDLLYGQTYLLDDNSHYEIAPILRYSKPHENNHWVNHFDNPQLKKRITQRINNDTLRFVVPDGCEIHTTEGKSVAGPGATIRGAIVRCHRSTSTYDNPWYLAKSEVATAKGFDFYTRVGRPDDRGIQAAMYLPVEWATGVLHGGHYGWSDDVDYEFEPAPDWGDREQVFGYQKRLEVLRERPTPQSFLRTFDITEIE